MSTPLVIVGCGGFGREVQDVVEAVSAAARAGAGGTAYHLLGYVDDAPAEVNRERVAARKATLLGPTSWLADAPAGTQAVIGIGVGPVRRRIDELLIGWRVASPVLVHPAATLGSQVQLAPGVIVCAGARLTTNIRLGRHAHVHVNSAVGHETTLGDYASLYPMSSLSGDVTFGDGATLGTNATVLQGRTIGRDAFVGAGACVTRDVRPGVVVRGVPAR